MKKIDKSIFLPLYRQNKNSHKGQNGKLTIIGGSKLFHGASFWALKTASRLVDMVFYATVKENAALTHNLKSQLYDFICIPKNKIGEYIQQSDAVLIGPGMVRGEKKDTGTGESGQETRLTTQKFIHKYPNKKWIIDAGSLQELEAKELKKLDQIIITPHFKELKKLFKIKAKNFNFNDLKDLVFKKAKEYSCIIVLKGRRDIVCSPQKCSFNTTGNEGMTKGGTGDVLAGLIAALSCKNDLFLAAQAGIYINGLAGDELYQTRGSFFNASDLCEQIPKTMKKLLNH